MGYQCFSVLLRYLYRIIKHLNEETTKVLFYNNMNNCRFVTFLVECFYNVVDLNFLIPLHNAFHIN
jgi:hypothetical protein